MRNPFKRKRIGIKRSKGEGVVFFIAGALFLFYAALLIVPTLWMVMSSFKHFADYTLDLTDGKPFKLPETWVWQNYADAFLMMEVEGTSFLGMIFNSLWQALIPIAISMLVSTAFAYTVARFEFPGRNLIYTLIITVMVMPIMTGSGATFKLYRMLGLYDTPFLKIVGALGWGNFMYYYGFFKSVSRSYSEAVYIDGGGEFTTFFNIILPQAIPIITALSVLSFIASWNDYLNVLLYLPSYPSVGSGLYIVKNTFLRTGKDPIYYAGSTIAMIPTLLMFVAFSDKIMTNMSIGGLKG